MKRSKLIWSTMILAVATAGAAWAQPPRDGRGNSDHAVYSNNNNGRGHNDVRRGEGDNGAWRNGNDNRGSQVYRGGDRDEVYRGGDRDDRVYRGGDRDDVYRGGWGVYGRNDHDRDDHNVWRGNRNDRGGFWGIFNRDRDHDGDRH